MLQLLAASPGDLTLGDVSRSLDLAKGTAHGILRTLECVGFVEHDGGSGRYRLGAAVLHLGSSRLDVNELRARSVNWADGLAVQTGEAVRIGSLADGEVLVVHHVFRPDDSPQTLDVGARQPAHATALGKVLLAYAPSVARTLPALTAFTRRTIADHAALSEELRRVRGEDGLASEAEEWLTGQASTAAPIRGRGGLTVGSIGVSGPVDRVCRARREVRPALRAAVADCARAISRELATD